MRTQIQFKPSKKTRGGTFQQRRHHYFPFQRGQGVRRENGISPFQGQRPYPKTQSYRYLFQLRPLLRHVRPGAGSPFPIR